MVSDRRESILRKEISVSIALSDNPVAELIFWIINICYTMSVAHLLTHFSITYEVM